MNWPNAPTPGSVSRRDFVGLVTGGLAVSVLPAGAWAASGRTGQGAGTSAPFTGGWLEREYLGARLASHPVFWHCASTGAALELTTEGVWLDEPGWGRHRFPLTALRDGSPQEVVRRVFGHTVADELWHSADALLRR